jgi:DNA-binding transcriptional LysR family regulator
MQQMNLSTVDLNLLVALDALLRTRSTTLASRELALSQSATSHALARLRELFADPLLLRSGRGLVPSALGVELAPRVKQALDSVRLALGHRTRFEPSTSQRVFELGTEDYGSSVIVPRLAQLLARRAPRVDVFVKPNPPLSLLGRDLCEVELVLSPLFDPASEVTSEVLFHERFVCVLRKDHPRARRGLDLDTFCSLGHVLVAPRSETRHGSVDDALAAIGRTRRIAVTVPHFLAAPLLVTRTDYVLTLMERVARTLRLEGLMILEPPVALAGMKMAMHWHRRFDADQGHAFLRECLRRVARDLSGRKALRRKHAP